jgi:hypothetical protein
VWKPLGRSAPGSYITFLTVTGSAGAQNIIYSQWTVVFFLVSNIRVYYSSCTIKAKSTILWR